MLNNVCFLCEHDLVIGQYIIIQQGEIVCDACCPDNISSCDWCLQLELKDFLHHFYTGETICEYCKENY